MNERIYDSEWYLLSLSNLIYDVNMTATLDYGNLQKIRDTHPHNYINNIYSIREQLRCRYRRPGILLCNYSVWVYQISCWCAVIKLGLRMSGACVDSVETEWKEWSKSVGSRDLKQPEQLKLNSYTDQ